MPICNPKESQELQTEVKRVILHDAANETSLSPPPTTLQFPRHADEKQASTQRGQSRNRSSAGHPSCGPVVDFFHAKNGTQKTQQTSIVDMSKASTQSVADTSTGRPQGVSLAFCM